VGRATFVRVTVAVGIKRRITDVELVDVAHADDQLCERSPQVCR
jgi:hypothetical protein